LQTAVGRNGSRIESGTTSKSESGIHYFVIPGEDPGSILFRCPLQAAVGRNGSRIESGMTVKSVYGMTVKSVYGMTVKSQTGTTVESVYRIVIRHIKAGSIAAAKA